MYRRYISSVAPLADYILQVDFVSGRDKFRFQSIFQPQVWNSAVTNGIFVRFGGVELSHDEILAMAEREH